MPSVSTKQHNFMSAISNNPAFAKKVGIPQSVGQDFTTADKGRKFSKGGDMKRMADGGMSDLDKTKMSKYRKQPNYGGYEDYAPSGRSALEVYNKNDTPKRRIAPPKPGYPDYDPVAAKKAQSVQREAMNEGRRETRNTVPEEELKNGGRVMATMNPGFMAMMAKKKGMHEMPDGKMMKDSAMKKMNMGGMAEGGKADMKQDKAMMQKAVNKHEGRLHKGATMTKLATGGSFRASANGIATKGKTKATQIKMNKGGKAC